MDPRPPEKMSSDGREVWDWADRLSAHTQLLHDRRVLSQQIHNTKTQCGSCSKWMTDACPRESQDNIRGHKIGPSCQAVKCDQFTMSPHDVKQLASAEERLAVMNAKLAKKD